MSFVVKLMDECRSGWDKAKDDDTEIKISFMGEIYTSVMTNYRVIIRDSSGNEIASYFHK